MIEDPKITAFPDAEAFDRLAPVLSSWAEECQVELEEMLVERIVPARSYTGIFGRRSAAKTFFALDLAFSGATGMPFLGEETRRFGSIYCVGEKKSRFGKRVVAWRKARGQTTPPGLLFRWGVPDLLDEESVGDFIAEVLAVKPEFRRRGAPLGAIFLDTLSRSMKGRNVSDADAAGTALNAIQRIVDETGCTVLPLAHVAKAIGSDTQKGAGEWEDAADALIRIDRKEMEAVRTVSLTKQSDGPDGGTYAFELDEIVVGTAHNGRAITSCVIRQVDVPDDGKGRGVRLNASAELVLTAMGRLADEGQLRPIPSVPGAAPGTKGATMDALRAKAFDLGLQRASAPPAEAPETEQRKWVEARKKAFQRAVDKLVEAGKIRQEGVHVWAL